MRLSDIISNASDLSLYPKVGLILFLAAFLSILYRTLRRPRVQTSHWGAMPLDDGPSREHPDDNQPDTLEHTGARSV